MHVLILGARAPACLEWARAFQACGWQVSAADSIAWPLTRFSRTVDAYFQLPPPRFATRAWIEELIQLVNNHQIDLIVPCCEEAFYLSHGMAELTLHCEVFTSDFKLMHQLHHKGNFALMTQSWNICAPETHLIETSDELMTWLPKSEEWVFKPAYSRFATQTLIKPSGSTLQKIHPTVTQPWIAQRFIEGKEFCSFSVLQKGQLRAHACYHPRHRVGKGSGIWFEPHNPPEIEEFLNAFGRHTGYTGQIGFDFMQSHDGSFHVLECNPRGTSGVHLFAEQHRELIDALTQARNQALLANQAPRMVGLAMLLFAAPRTLLSPRRLMPLLRDYRLAHDVIGTPNDNGPLWLQPVSLLNIIGRSIRHRVSLLSAATWDIEWDGQNIGN